jgi:hypothetical protein
MLMPSTLPSLGSCQRSNRMNTGPIKCLQQANTPLMTLMGMRLEAPEVRIAAHAILTCTLVMKKLLWFALLREMTSRGHGGMNIPRKCLAVQLHTLLWCLPNALKTSTSGTVLSSCTPCAGISSPTRPLLPTLTMEYCKRLERLASLCLRQQLLLTSPMQRMWSATTALKVCC